MSPRHRPLRSRVRFQPCRAAVLLIALALAFVSCGDDDSGTTPYQPGPQASGPPLIARAPYPPQPVIAVDDADAREAKHTVAGQFNMVRYVFQSTEGVVSSLNAAAWVRQNEGCWARTMGSPAGCTYTLTACLRGGSYEWSEVMQGQCGLGAPGGPPPDVINWTSFRGSTDLAASSGRFTAYRWNTTSVETSWSWGPSTTPGSQVWHFYDGAESQANHVAKLLWSRGEDNVEEYDWTWLTTGRWIARVSSNGHEGTVQLFYWDPVLGDWVLQHEIEWEPAAGSWRTFDAERTIVRERTW